MIRTHDLVFRFLNGTTIAYPDVALEQGGTLLVSGASGCGKSTWLALVAALAQPSAGELLVAGQALAGLGKRAGDAWRARTVGFLPQRLHLSSALTVQQNLAMAQWASGAATDANRISAALESLGVAALAQRKPAQLSGGQAQRVALARAVLGQPKLILADEPTASLDDAAATDAVTLLRQTAEQLGASLVIATHDARVATVLAQTATGNSHANIHANSHAVQTLALARLEHGVQS